jgi:hypothetical protein
MSNKMWDVLVEHAKTCVLSGKHYVYYAEDERNVGVVFNNIYEFCGLISSGQYYSADSLSESQKVYVDTLVKKAYDNWRHVIEYDGKSLLSFKQNKSLGASQTEVFLNSQDYSNSFDQQQFTLPTLPVPVPSEQPSMDSAGLTVGGYNDNTRFPLQSQNVNLNAPIQFDGTSIPLQNPLIGSSHQALLPRSENLLALGPSQSSTSGFQTVGASNLTSYRGVEDYFPEEEIRMRSHEMLENEDMQHLLRFFNMGGHGSINATEDGYPYPSPYMGTPSLDCNFDDDRTRSSGKAVVGWLKLKAALRWGIFIRKKAAERRAQLVELDDP